MNTLIKEAEEIIQANTTPRICQLYQAQKKKIFFGPFAEVINTYQIENQDIQKKLSILSAQKPDKDLRIHAKNTLIKTIKEMVNSQYDSKAISLNDIVNDVYEGVQAQEMQKRTEISRYRSNITKYENKIKESKDVSIDKASPSQDNRQQLSNKAKKTQYQLNIMKMNLEKMLKENVQFNQKIQNAQLMITKKQESINQLKSKVREMKQKNDELKEYRDDIEKELQSMSDKVQKTILLQRFGPDVLKREKTPKVQQVIQLREEITRLKEEKSQLESEKKSKLIQTIKSCQKNYTLSQALQY